MAEPRGSGGNHRILSAQPQALWASELAIPLVADDSLRPSRASPSRGTLRIGFRLWPSAGRSPDPRAEARATTGNLRRPRRFYRAEDFLPEPPILGFQGAKGSISPRCAYPKYRTGLAHWILWPPYPMLKGRGMRRPKNSVNYPGLKSGAWEVLGTATGGRDVGVPL